MTDQTTATDAAATPATAPASGCPIAAGRPALVAEHVAIAPPPGVPVWDIDPYDEDILRDPRDYYAELRAKGPFVYSERYSMLLTGRFAEVREVFSNHARFTSEPGVGIADFRYSENWRPKSIILEVDPPYHTRTRLVLSRTMSPKVVAGLVEDFRAVADRLVDDLLARDSFDGVTELAEVFPTTVFPRFVGMTESNPRMMIDLAALVFNAVGPDNELRRRAMQTIPPMVEWTARNTRREALLPGGFGRTIYAAADDGLIDEHEAGMLVRALLSAGVDTTVTGIGNAVWCLGKNPDQYDRLTADPSLARQAFEEVLRYTSPVHAFCRTATAPTEVSGVAIPEAAKILCVLGAANLDPLKWPDADRFDITRKATGHVAFGTGIHGCVGQSVARGELEALLQALAAKVKRIEFLEEPVWRANNAIHALDRMPMRLIPH